MLETSIDNIYTLVEEIVFGKSTTSHMISSTLDPKRKGRLNGTENQVDMLSICWLEFDKCTCGLLYQLSLIFSRLSTLAEAKKRSKTMPFFSMLLVVTNEPTTSITPIIKMIHTNTCISISVKPDQLWKHDPPSPLYTDSHLFPHSFNTQWDKTYMCLRK